MRKIIVFISFLWISSNISAQFELTPTLVDSLICKLYNFDQSNKLIYKSLSILNFASYRNQKNSIYVSRTSINQTENIQNNMMMYINENKVFFVILRNVNVDSSFRSKLIDYNNPRFEKVLDSIKFSNYANSGFIVLRSPLEVFRIRKKLCSQNTYIITEKRYIPYLSAPDEFIPLNDGRESKEIEPWYYDYKPVKKLNKKHIPLMELNKKYYEDMKPREKIILKMPKDK